MNYPIKLGIVRVTGEFARFNEYYDSVDGLVTPPGTEILPCHTSSPAKNRNHIIKQALEAERFTHLFFTDDDMFFDRDTVMRLLSHDVDIVSGMYTMKVEPFPIIALRNPNEKDMSQFINMNEVEPNVLIEIPRLPAGCLMCKTEALKVMRDHITAKNPKYKDIWFTLGHIFPDEWGDDLWFCDRARDAGLKTYLDTGVAATHLTKVGLKPVWNDIEKKWEIQFKINEGYRIGNMDANLGRR